MLQFESRPSRPPPVGYSRGDPLHNVEAILHRKWDNEIGKRRKEWFYLVKWEGFDSSENTYERRSNLRNVKSLVDEYDDAHPPPIPGPKLPKW